ncbi:MAG: outer membrane beta-barrel protein [Nitrospira sp.]|nr:outer membrane beta-barrel protein [Nitrospira sp.]
MKKVMLMVILLAVAVMLAMPNTGKAEPFGKGKFQFEVGLRHMTVYTVDTTVTGGLWGVGILGMNDPRIVGFGADFKYGLSDDWAINWGGFFGFGNEKWEFTGDDINYKVQAFGFSAGIDRTVNLSSMVGLYFGPGLSWTSSRSEVEENGLTFLGFDDTWTNPRVNAFSLTGRVGVQAMLGTHFGIDANMNQKWSKVSFSEAIGSPAEELKVSSWTSSMGGSAGFVIYIN